MYPKPYPLADRCVEDGLRLGLQRVGKHSLNGLAEDQIREALEKCHEAVMLELAEWFDFGDEP